MRLRDLRERRAASAFLPSAHPRERGAALVTSAPAVRAPVSGWF